MQIRNRVLGELNIPEKSKIVVAMSGGVDSTTVAALLHDAGHDVIGVTLQLYDHGVAVNKKGACCAGIDIYDAQMAAEKIGIPHYVFNYEGIFYDAVMKPFAESYARGETPIPCILCNQKVKFRDLFAAANDLDADYMATGHYVQRKITHDGRAELHKAADHDKDQSYFLFTTTQNQLNRLLFPLGILNKSDTRMLAEYYGLSVANKPDSQDICFVPNGNYRDIVARILPETTKAGDIILENDGSVIGKHNGVMNYTVGQRRGIAISHTEPLYVLKIDAEKNQVIVGARDKLSGQKLEIIDMNWLNKEALAHCDIKVRLRSTHQGVSATINFVDDSAIVLLHEEGYFGITPGQACVVYDDNCVLGGGWIKRQIHD